MKRSHSDSDLILAKFQTYLLGKTQKDYLVQAQVISAQAKLNFNHCQELPWSIGVVVHRCNGFSKKIEV